MLPQHPSLRGTDGQHTDAASGGSMAVGAQQGLARLTEPFQVYLVANTVAGTGKIDAVFGGYGAQKAVVVSIFKSWLQGIMIYIADRQLCFDLGDSHCLELQIGHGSCGILSQSLVLF